MKNKMFYIDKNETIEDILKQIKEWFEYDNEIVSAEKVAYFKEDTFNKFLDYITNLQKENKNLEEVNKCIIDTNTLLIKQKDRLYNDLDNLSDRVDNALCYINSTDFIYDLQYKKKDKLIEILKGE